MPPSEQNETVESSGLGEGQQPIRSHLCVNLVEGGHFLGLRALFLLTHQIY